jgi:hypothetical protein
MADFEAWIRPFDFKLEDGSRDYEAHKKLLSALLDAIISNVDRLFGIVAEPEPSKPAFKDAYETNVAKLVKEAAIETAHSGERITVVFAKHKDFKAARIGEFFDLWDDGDGRVKFGGVGEPADLPQLQVADLIAYEMSRWSRTSNRPEDDRYPLRRLKEGIRLKGQHGRFLLTFIP